ncbi:MAG: glycoside hydrolase family 20 zincin-like fold domain-containing protein [Verrucomicrobiae bacterium]|nr:glycoside hydrolase family 20 zincin-like fold domain-containing protein [Verrucomicrobiae bacterium]
MTVKRHGKPLTFDSSIFGGLWGGVGILVFLFFSNNIAQAAVAPFLENNEIIVFDADKNDLKDLVNYTMSWKKGSDMMPQLSSITNDKGKWITFSYHGSQGAGISRLDIEPGGLAGMIPEGTDISGIEILINYDGEEFEKIQIMANFGEGNDFLAYHLPLEKGAKEYRLEKGFRKVDFPADWTRLKYIWLQSGNAKMAFMLKRIFLITRKSEKKAISLEMDSAKKVHEVLPTENVILKNDKTINEAGVDKALSLRNFCRLRDKQNIEEKNSPLKAKIACDENHLLIATEAEFPAKPLANVKRQDDEVYQDEALEFFFSPWNDNNRKMQFCVNIDGVVFDSLRDYDLAAAEVVNSREWNLPHVKKTAYANGVWKTLFVVSLKDLKIDLEKCRFMGFQLAQNYCQNSVAEKFKTLAWSSTESFPNALDFGILVFNKKPFGNGDIEIREILSRKKNDGNELDLSVKMLARNFAEGEFKMETVVVAADHTSVKNVGKINISQKENEHTVKIKSVKDLDGGYTLYVGVCNKNNDLKMAAVNFKNQTALKDLFGKDIFSPEPKKVAWKEGVFMAGNADKILVPENASERTVKTAKLFKDRLCGFAASPYSVRKSGSAQKNFIGLKISNETNFDGQQVKLRNEGYCLDVRPDGVDIIGADEAGLYYGCVTFVQLLKMPMKIADGAPVKCVRILDWPDLPNRLLRLDHPWQFRNGKFKEVPKIEWLMEWTERFVAENKLNRLWLDVAALIKYERRPEFNGAERVFSLDDLKKYGEFCRDRFVEVIPSFEVGGHAGWWLLGYHPELGEKGYRDQSDVTHPEHHKVVFNCLQDVIDALKPKYVSPKGDEWWHDKDEKTSPDEFLRGGKTRAEAFLDFYVELNQWLRERKVGMQIYEDMLDPRHNGKRWDVYKVIDKFPRDIIINAWAGGTPDLAAAYFLDKGFEVWGNATGYWTYGEKVKTRVGGFGGSSYDLGSNWRLYRTTPAFSICEVFLAADHAWNILCEKQPVMMDELASGKLAALREMYAVAPNSHASSKVGVLDIQKDMNSSFEDILHENGEEVFLPKGTRTIGNIPTLFAEQKMNCLMLDEDKTIFIPPGNCSSLIFLQTIAIDKQTARLYAKKILPWRDWPYGYVLGHYQAFYDDGTIEKLPVRLCWNVDIMDAHPLYRTTNNNRYVLPVKTSKGGYRFLYQWEWINPHPAKKIVKITYANNSEFKYNGFKFAVLLFALSQRDKK